MTSLDALGIRIGPEPWMRDARCVYGNAPQFLGRDVFDPATGERLMDAHEFYARFDQAFFSQHDDRWMSGSETLSLYDAVRECLACPVRTECLRHAVADDTTTNTGIAGATTPWERRTVMSDRRRLLTGLDREGRIRVLERLVAAKEAGLVRLSTQADHLSRWLEAADDDAEAERIATEAQVALDAEEAEDIVALGEVSQELADRIDSVMAKAWADMTPDDIQRLIAYADRRPE